MTPILLLVFAFLAPNALLDSSYQIRVSHFFSGGIAQSGPYRIHSVLGAPVTGSVSSGVYILSVSPFVPQQICVGDITLDGMVDGQDLSFLLAAWGEAEFFPSADLNSDGIVNGIDLAYVLNAWGDCDE